MVPPSTMFNRASEISNPSWPNHFSSWSAVVE
jgi:hypothetical protein